MKIDLSKLKMHHWFEDEDGNMYSGFPSDALPDKDYFSYHRIFPCTYNHEIDEYCNHPRYRHENNPFYQALLHFKPFYKWMQKRHRKEKTFKHIFGACTTYGSEVSQKCIVSMVNSGDYTLEEAIYVYCNACERCMNVLLYKYLDGTDGYEENSDEWKRCNTVCDWCRNEDRAD